MKVKHIVVIVGVLLLLLAGAFTYYEMNKKYIGGNVFSMVFMNQFDDNQLVSPWVNNGFQASLIGSSLFLAHSNLLDFSPDLADSYEILENGLVYKITLKTGIVWSDGQPFVPEDVVFSIESASIATRSNHLYKTAFSKIDSMEIDGNTITFRLKERTTLLLPVLAQLVIMPKHILEHEDMVSFNSLKSFWKDPVVLGMYKVGRIIPDDHIVLVPNELHHGKKPNIAEIKLYLNTDTVKVDFYHTNHVSEMINFRAMRGFKEYKVDMLFYRYFIYNVCGNDGFENPAMQDVRVRKAIAYAINKEKHLNDIYFNMGAVVSGDFTPSSSAEGEVKYDPEMAKKLLAEAKYDFSRPLRLTYYYGDDTSLYFMNQAVKDLENVGFTVEMFKAPVGSVTLYSDRNYDVALKGLAAFEKSEWFLEYGSTHPFLTKIFGGKGEFDELNEKIVGETDRREYARLLRELEKLENDLFYKYSLFTLGQSVYINTDRMDIPEGVVFSNFLYNSDIDFANWKVKRE